MNSSLLRASSVKIERWASELLLRWSNRFLIVGGDVEKSS